MPEVVVSPPPEFHTPDETASILRFKSTKTLERLHKRGNGPPRVKIGAKTVLYPRVQLLEWIVSHATVPNPHPKKRGRPTRKRKAAAR